MKKLTRLLTITLAILLCISFSCLFAFANTGENGVRSNIADEAILMEAMEPIIDSMKEAYIVHGTRVIDPHWETTQLGTALYGTVSLDMTLRAQSADDMTIFQGILQQANLSSVYDVAEVDFRALLQTEHSAFLREVNTTADSVTLSECATEALQEMVDNYTAYIGYRSDFNFPICVTVDKNGNLENSYADCEGVRRNINIYLLSSRTEVAQNGIRELQAKTAQRLSAVETQTITKPLYYRVDARDYANRWTSEATYSQTCPHGNHYINLSAYNPYVTYYCHRDCSNFVSQAIRVGQIPVDATWYVGSTAWKCADDLYFYLKDEAKLIAKSNFYDCNAGNLIFNFSSESGTRKPYHVNMCVHNDGQVRKFSAHNRDHLRCVYTISYWGDAEYYVFPYSTTASHTDDFILSLIS